MTQSGLLETRSRLSQIVQQVLLGEEHVILKNNVPVAKIVPVEETRTARSKAAVEEIKRIRRQVGLFSIEEINQWKKDGRRS
jgi:antitoxin (DNA-binding transcriptional repressor) of toxin-antitoxin stability system